MTSPQLGEVINTLEHSAKPIVAAVDGLALGGQKKQEEIGNRWSFFMGPAFGRFFKLDAKYISW